MRQFSDSLKKFYFCLIKIKKYYYPDNLVRLNLTLNGIMKIVQTLPEGLNTSIEAKIFSEIQNLSKDFGKQLKGYKKSSEKNLESATESLQQITMIANRINNFSIPFLNQLFSNQISAILVDIRNNKSSFEEKMVKENLKTISFSTSFPLSDRPRLSISSCRIRKLP